MIKHISIFGATALMLSACGGGSTSTVSYTTLTSTAAATTNVQTLALDTGARSTSATASTYDNAAQTFQANGNTITADTATLTSGLDYVASVASASASAAGTTQLAAVQTETSDMPSTGTATFNGSARANVNDATNIYEGTMDATVTVNFATNDVDVALSNLSATGAQQTVIAGGATSAYTPTGSEVVTLDNATISGAGFTGGTAASTAGWGSAGAGTALTGALTIDQTGVFAGPSAAEIAGVAFVEGATTGVVSFVYAGEQ